MRSREGTRESLLRERLRSQDDTRGELNLGQQNRDALGAVQLSFEDDVEPSKQSVTDVQPLSGTEARGRRLVDPVWRGPHAQRVDDLRGDHRWSAPATHEIADSVRIADHLADLIDHQAREEIRREHWRDAA